MKSVLISIQPKWCELIARGKKTVEVRKTRPKLETPFKVYIYCTEKDYDKIFCVDKLMHKVFLNGKGKQKVIGEFVCNEIEEYHADDFLYGTYDIGDDEVIRTCLADGLLWEYGKGGNLYGWHISNLVIYDEPKDLSEFKKVSNGANKCRQEFFGKDFCDKYYSDLKVTRPPQSWCYVWSETE